MEPAFPFTRRLLAVCSHKAGADSAFARRRDFEELMNGGGNDHTDAKGNAPHQSAQSNVFLFDNFFPEMKGRQQVDDNETAPENGYSNYGIEQ
jgi:hypothetical protein